MKVSLNERARQRTKPNKRRGKSRGGTGQNVLFISTVIMTALSLVVLPQPAWAAEKKDDKAVLDEVLDILKEKGQITEQKYQELKARAKKEGAGKLLAGFKGWTPYI